MKKYVFFFIFSLKFFKFVMLQVLEMLKIYIFYLKKIVF